MSKDLIKSVDSDSEDDRRSSKKPREGDKCEAEFKNTGKFYPGTGNCLGTTCDIVFDDGDKQSHVEASRIKVKGGGRSRSRSRSVPAARRGALPRRGRQASTLARLSGPRMARLTWPVAKRCL